MTHTQEEEELFALFDEVNRRRAEHVAQGGAESGISLHHLAADDPLRAQLTAQSSGKRRAYHDALRKLLATSVDYLEDRWCEVKLAPRVPAYFVPAQEELRTAYLAHVRDLVTQTT